MKNIIANICRGGAKTLGYLLAALGRTRVVASAIVALFALAAAQSAQAAVYWKGTTDNKFSTSSNWKSGSYNLVFDHGTETVTRGLIYLDSDYTDKFKFTTDNTARYRNLIFRKAPTNAGWILCGWYGNAKHKYDQSGSSNGDGSLNIADTVSNKMRISAIDLKVRQLTVGKSDYTYAGDVILDEYDSDGTTYRAPVTIETSSSYDTLFNKGTLFATNATLTCGGITRFRNFSVVKNGGNWTLNSNTHIANGADQTASLVQDGGKIDAKGDFYVGNPGTGSLTIDSGTLNVASDKIAYIGRSGGTGTLTVNDGNVNVGDCYFGENSATGTLTVNGGTVEVASGKWTRFESGSTSTINLYGGTFKTRYIKDNGASSALVLLDGGTIQVNGNVGPSGDSKLIDSTVNVRVGANGGTINTGTKTFYFPAAINAVENTAGAFAVTGGGTAMFSAMGDLSGAFTIGENTALRWFDQDGVVSNYTVSAINIGPGATLYLDADETGCDTFNATTTNITATAANPATIKLIVREMPESGHHFKLFAMDEADTNKVAIVAETPAGASLVVERGYDTDGYLTYAILAKDYVWNASQTNWSGTDAWDVDGKASDWQNNNNAVFTNAGSTVTLDANATAVKLDFRADATVSGGAILTVPEVTVASGVSGSIDAATAGTLVKKGAGALTLGAARPAQTTVEEGTLALTNGDAAVTTANLTLGTDPEKSVTFDYGGNTLSGDPRNYLVAGMDITLTNGVFSTDVNPGFKAGTAPGTLTIASGAELATSNNWTWNASMEADVDTTNTINIAGGKMVSTKNTDNWLVQNSRCGTLNINVTDGGLLELGGETYALVGRDSTTTNDTPSLNIKVVDSTFRIANSKSLRFGRDNNNKNPLRPTGVFAATNAVIDLGYAMYVGNNKAGTNTEGYYTADFENCTITGRQISVYQDRPLNAVRFNNTRYVINADRDYWLETAAEFETLGEGGTAIKPMSVGPGGLVLDSNGYNGQLQADLQGEGAFTKAGTGTMTVTRSQTSDAPFNVEKGAVVFNAGLSVARPVSVASGATLKAPGAATLSGGVTLAGGAILDVNGTAAVAADVTVSSGTATLKLNGGEFGKGLYPIVTKTGVTAADFANVEPVLASGLTGDYLVKDDTLYLAVDMDMTGFVWTGLAGDGKMSTAGNWWGGVAPDADDDVDFSSVWSATTIDGDINAAFGAVTMGSGVITFTGDKMRATAFSDTSKIAVGANATVTVVGDLMFADKTSDFYVLNTIGEGGKFVVTGTFGLESSCTGRPVPQQSRGSGIIVVGGIRDNAETWMFAASNGDPAQKWVVGEQGVSGASTQKGFWMYNNANSAAEFQAYTNDFEYALKTCFRTNAKRFTLNTTGYGDDEGHTITLNAGFYNNGDPLVIAGKGKVVCAATATGTVTDGNSTLNPYSGEVVVTNTATLAINPDKVLTTGAITVHDGAALEVAESGAVSIGGNLTLKNNATLGFNFTERTIAPVLAVSSVTADGAIKVAVSGKWPKVTGADRKVVLTSGGAFAGVSSENISLVTEGKPTWAKSVAIENGEIVLQVKPMAIMVIVK